VVSIQLFYPKEDSINSVTPDSTLCGLLSVGVLCIWARWACFRLAFAMEKIRSTHAEPHFRTPWLTRLFSITRLERKDFPEATRLQDAEVQRRYGYYN